MILLSKQKIDVMRHEFVPKHVLLTKDETIELLNKYKISLIDLPMVLNTDPAVFAVGGREGDVIKILRKSQTTHKEIEYYRYVTKEKTS